MTKRIGGFRRKTRNKLKKLAKNKGKIRIKDYFQQFKIDEKVILKAEPAVQTGMYFPRFHAKTGVVKGKKGKCYEVRIKDGGKKKTLIVHPVHLQKV